MCPLVRDDPKLPDDSGEYPKPNRVIGRAIPRCGMFSLPDGRFSQVTSRIMCSQKSGKEEVNICFMVFVL